MCGSYRKFTACSNCHEIIVCRRFVIQYCRLGSAAMDYEGKPLTVSLCRCACAAANGTTVAVLAMDEKQFTELRARSIMNCEGDRLYASFLTEHRVVAA